MRHHARFAVVVGVALLVWSGRVDGQEPFRFRSGVELVNVSATVTDRDGRFVSGLQQADFAVYEDDQRVEITHFSAERVPVSLGIVLDTSGSMRGQKLIAARVAVRRLLFDLLGAEDEVFLYRFTNVPSLVEGWTTDRERIITELGRIEADGDTAMYDAVAAALPLMRSGRHRKKALLIVSDGVDTSSKTDLQALKRLIRESEALVYAIGIDAHSTLKPLGGAPMDSGAVRYQRRRPIPLPFPIPGRGRPPRNPPIPGVPPGRGTPPPRMPPPNDPGTSGGRGAEEYVNATALRDITDDSGGRTEIVRAAGDLGGATTHIADELSKQYYLGYPTRGHHDGRWHTIRVEVRGQSLHVRARRGYIAGS